MFRSKKERERERERGRKREEHTHTHSVLAIGDTAPTEISSQTLSVHIKCHANS